MKLPRTRGKQQTAVREQHRSSNTYHIIPKPKATQVTNAKILPATTRAVQAGRGSLQTETMPEPQESFGRPKPSQHRHAAQQTRKIADPGHTASLQSPGRPTKVNDTLEARSSHVQASGGHIIGGVDISVVRESLEPLSRGPPRAPHGNLKSSCRRMKEIFSRI
jgi:hypothetical protein